MNTILITGSTGFFGRNFRKKIDDKQNRVYYSDSRYYDLCNLEQTQRLFKDTEPDIVIHLAGKVGGILENSMYPADFFYENMAMGLNIFNTCQKHKIKKLVTLMGGCSYPSNAISPIQEEDMWNGYPQKESSAYSVAKKTFLTMSTAYREQYELNSIVLIPGNAYGPHDNFSVASSHVIPGIIRKISIAQKKNSGYITLFGSGQVYRDFVYIDDVVDCILQLMETHNTSDPINISSGKKTKISDLVDLITELMDYRGEVHWDLSKPEGQYEKVFDVSKLHARGLYCATNLVDGLTKTIQWFKDNVND